jgi:hypothetical protein
VNETKPIQQKCNSAYVCVCVCMHVCMCMCVCARACVDMCDAYTVTTMSTHYFAQFCAEGLHTRKLFKTLTVNPTYENL